VIDRVDANDSSNDSISTTISRVSKPLDAFVIARLTAKGFGTKEYVDPQTFFLVRSESIRASGTTTTEYGPYATYGAAHLATSWHVHNESTGTDTDYSIAEHIAENLGDDDVAIPGNRRTLVQFPDGQTSVTLPSLFSRNGHVYVRLVVNGRGLDFLLDTGSSVIAINGDVARQLGLSPKNTKQNNVNAGSFASGEVIVPHVQVGALSMNDVVMTIAPENSRTPDAAIRAVGVLGFDFIYELGITIDYEHHVVTAAKAGTYHPPDDPQLVTLNVRLGTQAPFVTAGINGAVAERMIFDTGAAGTLLIFDYFARHHPEAMNGGTDIPASRTFYGVGGSFETHPYEVKESHLGSQVFTDIVGYRVVSSRIYSMSADGIIGTDVIKLFNVMLDYPNGRIYLWPNNFAGTQLP
jgi:clan AA aspartic protease (TIGR02281 family)